VEKSPSGNETCFVLSTREVRDGELPRGNPPPWRVIEVYEDFRAVQKAFEAWEKKAKARRKQKLPR
jgi:hypothetical protein